MSGVHKYLLLPCLLAAPATAWATNGMNMLSYDARVAGLAGADTTLGSSALAVASNPAGITLSGPRLDANLSLLLPSLSYDDSVTTPAGSMNINMDFDSAAKVFPLFGVGYSQELTSGLYGGVAVFVQGGMGADFEGLATFADDDPTTPTQAPSAALYDTHSQVQYMKIAPTLAYRTELLSLGASLHAGLAKMEWRHTGMQFPEGDGDHVYVPHTVDFSSGWAFGVAGRFGALLRFLDDRVRLGASYMTATSLKFEGDMSVDGQLQYDASTDDFGWPQEVVVGASGGLFDRRLRIAADLRWTQWSRAVDTVTFDATAKDPASTPVGFGALTLPFQMKWRDGLAVSVGAEYEALEDLLWLRVGYNHSRTVVTEDGINNLFPPVTSHHVTGGLGMQDVVGGLGFDLAVEYALATSVASGPTNQMAFEPPLPGARPSPNGYAFEVTMRQLTGYLTATYRF